MQLQKDYRKRPMIYTGHVNREANREISLMWRNAREERQGNTERCM